jgi:uncharacterized protein involved in outer membrane biogenesis
LRESLTALAIFVILVLTAALFGPMLIDWTARRSEVEARLSQALGAPVVTSGGIRLRLLPSPYIELGEIRIGPGNPAPFAAERARIELAVMPLLQGQIRIVDAHLTHPRLRLAIENGALVLPKVPRSAPEFVRFERIVITDADLNLLDKAGGVDVTLSGMNIDAAASSLEGPFKAQGTIKAMAGKTLAKPLHFQLATGVKQADHLKIRLTVEPDNDSLRADLDGLVLFGSEGQAERFEGTGIFAGLVRPVGASETAWHSTGVLRIDPGQVKYSEAELRAGPDDRALIAALDAQALLGRAPRVQADLKIRQLDLDRLLAATGDSVELPSALFGRIAGTIGDIGLQGRFGWPLAVEARADIVTLGGETLSDLSGAVDFIPGQVPQGRLDVSAPGRSRLIAQGSVETGTAARFAGTVRASSLDLRRFIDWLKPPPLAALPAALQGLGRLSVLQVAGPVELSATALSGHDLDLTLNRSKLHGSASLTRAVGSDPARLYADLTSNGLDLDTLPEVSGVLSAGQALDAVIALDAKAIKLNRTGQPPIEAGQMRLTLRKAGDKVQLEHFDLAGFGGADVAATGSSSQDGGKLTLSVNAQRLADLADVVARIAPSPWSSLIASRASALSPAQITIDVAAKASAKGRLDLTAVSLKGTAGATRLNAELAPEPADPRMFSASLVFDAPDSFPVLRQLGLSVEPIGNLGPTHAEVAIGGRFGVPLDILVDANIAGALWTGQGLVDGASFEGSLGLKSRDVGPLMQSLGVLPPGNRGGLAADLNGLATLRPGQASVHRLTGKFAGTQMTGVLDLGAEHDDEPLKLSGDLTLERLQASVLAGLALGQQAAPGPAATWSTQSFGAGLLRAPASDIDLRIASLDIAPGWTARDAHMRLGLAADRISFDEVGMALNGGSLGGRLTLRRHGTEAALSAHADLQSLALDTPALRMRATGSLEFAGTGNNVGALIGGLAGNGVLSFASLALPKLDPTALAQVVAKSESEESQIEEANVVHALAQALDRDQLSFEPQQVAIATATGVMRADPIEWSSGPSAVETRAAIDLRTLSIDLRTTLTLDQSIKFWSGPPPRISVVSRGPLMAPAREIDAASFVNGLQARAIARDTERIEMLDADIRERAFVNRRLKALDFLRQREGELQRFAEDEKRRKIEEDRRRALEAARAAAPAAAPADPGVQDPSSFGRY